MTKKFVIILLLNAFVFSQNVKELPIKPTQEIITLDGVLNESVWSEAAIASDFIQQFPFDSALSNNKTEIKITYDKKNIYIAAICYEKPNKKYVIESLRRDFNVRRNDCISILFDPFNDRLNGFMFSVSAFGVQRESMIENGGLFDGNVRWDNKWFSAVKKYNDKWVVEMKIPFKSIRYKKNLSEWNINFIRSVPDDNEISVWNKVPFYYNFQTLSFCGKLVWNESPPKTTFNSSIIPYVAGGFNYDNTSNHLTWNYGIGGDAKIAITPSLNLDITGNPDFSQVDVDVQVTNLTRFSLFFPEQRQFFLENSDLFSRFGFSRIRPFFSRRIGLNNGNQIPIIAGMRLSGKLSKNIRIGLMNIQTASKASLNVNLENFTVAALQIQVFNRSNLGFIFVNRNGFLQNDQWNPNDYNRVIGIDYDLASKDNVWIGKFFFHHSISPRNNENAMAHASFLAYNKKKFNFQWNHEYVGRNYNAEVGFVPRQFFYDQLRDTTIKQTYWRLEPSAEYSMFPKSKKIYKMSIGLYNSTYTDSVFKPTDILSRAYFRIDLYNTSSFTIGYNENFTRLIFPIDPTSSKLKPFGVGDYIYRDVNLSYNSNTRKRFTFSADATIGTFFTGFRLQYGFNANYRIQPYANIGISFSRNDIWFTPDVGNINLMLISPRFEITFNKNIFLSTSLQYNTQINNLNIYSRFQWRFAPMSDLFIVYSDNINTETLTEKNRGLQIKFVYWFNP